MNPHDVTRTIAFARLPGVIGGAVRDFRKMTGLTAVTTLGAVPLNAHAGSMPSPPVHPRCADVMRRTPGKVPCNAEWRKHLRSATKVQGCWMHTCPLGLCCAGVPIVLDEKLIGLAKLVSGPEIPKERFRSYVSLLEVLVARPGHELQIALLREKIQTLQASVNQLRRIKGPSRPTGSGEDMPPTRKESSDPPEGAQTLVGHLLEYLNAHYSEGTLSLGQVAAAVDKNPKYVTYLFTRQVGQRMRTYITTLRVRRACELLLQTDRTVKQIASDSGFTGTVQFQQSFRRTIGVTALEYRQIFTAGT